MFNFDTFQAEIAALREKEVFFVGGAIKSGTTWLQLLLDQHPDISCNGEGHFTNYLGPLLIKALNDYNEQIASKNEGIFQELTGYPILSEDHQTFLWLCGIALLMTEHSRHKTARVIGEKTPDNVRAFGVLDSVFPNARFIQIVRDGRDCAISGWFHNLRVARAWTLETYGNIDGFLKVSAECWARDIASGTKFGESKPDRYLVLRYEDLLTEPEPTLDRVFGFLQVDSTQQIRAECVRRTSFEELSGGRAPGQENRQSFFRSGTIGDWRRHLDADRDLVFREHSGRWLDYFGYL